MGVQEWPVGQVAVATVRGGERVRAMLDEDGDWHTTRIIAGYWVHGPELVTDVRPLVVLDPAEYRLLDLARNNLREALAVDGAIPLVIDGLIDAVLAQTCPPKPAEPTGLGAVVVDREGVVWQLADDMKGAANWRRAPERNAERTWRFYAEIDVERVAFEGVQP